MNNTISKIALILALIGLVNSIYIGTQAMKIKEVYDRFGTTIPIVVALFETTLATKITSTATSMTLTSGTDKDGNTLSGTYGFVIDEGTASEEFVTASCTDTACSSLARGISVVTGNTEISALKKAHRRGSSVKISNHPQLAVISRILNGDETVPNIISYASQPSFTGDEEITTKKYADDLAIAGSPDILETIKGIGELASIAELAAGTDTGGTGAKLLAHAQDFGNTSSAKQMVAVTDADGDIPIEFMELNAAWAFTGAVSGSSTVDILTATNWKLGGVAFTGAMADLNEAEVFFGATGISGAEAETLTDGSNADSLHVHADATAVLSGANDQLLDTSTTKYGTVMGAATSSASEDTLLQTITSRAGTLQKLYVRGIAPVGDSAVITIRVNGSPSALTVTLAIGATSGSDLVHTVAVSAGDRITVELNPGASQSTNGDWVVAVELES